MSLPTGYTEVQYIQSSGTQYVDTGVKVNKADAYKLVLTAHLTSNDNYAGCNGYMQFQANIGNDQKSMIAIEYANVTETISVNDVQISSTSWPSYDGQNVKLGLFKMGDTNDSWFSGSPQTGKLYSCQIYDNGSLIRNYVPCINPDGEAGLYDTVNSKFYGNAGTGVFFAGPPRVSLPSGYKQLEYILSDNTQYINTGIVPDQDSRIVYDCERSAGLTQERFFGVRTGSTATDAFYFYIYQSKWRYIYNNATMVGETAVDGRFLIDANKNIATINGTMTFTGTYGQFTCAMPALLFAARAAPSDMLRGTHKLFSCKMYQNGTLARNYIPCSNPSGELGLYDLVTRSFYENGGTNPFTAGPEVTWPSNNAIYVKVNGIWRQINGIKLL